MKILLVSSASYDPPRGGSTRSNLVWLKHLAGAGHECRVVCGFPVEAAPDQRESSPHPGITILSTSDVGRRAALHREVETFQPDFVLVSSEDLSHTLLREAHRSAPGRVVYLAHTPQFYPFGPASWNPDAVAAGLVARCAGVVAIASFTAGYIREYGNCDAAVIHPPIYGEPPFRSLGRPGAGATAMINPCGIKGISVFSDLARRFSHLPFAALPGWGTTAADRATLDSLPNFRWLTPCPDIEQMLGETRLLLMPSLWLEGFGLIVVEAMLRGIPVLASDSGGLRESTLGAGRLIPVNPICEFAPSFDDRHLPVPVIPEQNLEPWAAALSELENPAAYDAASRAAKTAAEQFVSKLQVEHFEHFLRNLKRPARTGGPPASLPAHLSEEKRELLLRRMRSAHHKGKPVQS